MILLFGTPKHFCDDNPSQESDVTNQLPGSSTSIWKLFVPRSLSKTFPYDRSQNNQLVEGFLRYVQLFEATRMVQ